MYRIGLLRKWNYFKSNTMENKYRVDTIFQCCGKCIDHYKIINNESEEIVLSTYSEEVAYERAIELNKKGNPEYQQRLKDNAIINNEVVDPERLVV